MQRGARLRDEQLRRVGGREGERLLPRRQRGEQVSQLRLEAALEQKRILTELLRSYRPSPQSS